MNDLVLFVHGGEARIRDVDLANRLGFAKATKIRDLIKRHRTSLEALGPLPTVGRVINGGGATEFCLNKKQAIFLTAKSETPTATEITIEIIERFDAYERGAAPDPMKALNDPATMRGLLLSYTGKVLALEAENASLTPKAKALDRIATAYGSLNQTEAAKTLQVAPRELTRYLSTHAWFYRRPGSKTWLGYQDRINAGLIEHKTDAVTLADGTERVVTQARITPKGLARLAEALLRPGTAQAA